MRNALLLIFVCSLTFAQAQVKSFPYQLNKSDYFLLPLGVGAEAFSMYMENSQKKMNYNDLLSLNKYSINSFDRSALSNWNSNMDAISDFGKWGLFVSPCAVLIPIVKNKEWKNTLTYGVMYFEVAMLTTGITNLTKVIAKRKRPYLYNSQLSYKQKQEFIDSGDANDSFFSGHTSIAFASAVYLSKTVSDIYGKNALSKIIWATSLSLASATAYLRYESGQHYPTDILAGALVGAAVGYFIPAIHKKEGKLENMSFMVVPNYATVAYRF